jgi:hypothetical protein
MFGWNCRIHDQQPVPSVLIDHRRLGRDTNNASVTSTVVYQVSRRPPSGSHHLIGQSVHLLQSMLFGVSPFDPLVLVLAAVCVLLLDLGASVPHALRAASVNPMQALVAE